MDIREIRREKLLELIARYKTQSAFANAIGKPASYISQIKKGIDKDGNTIAMGYDFARDIEEALGLDNGWMDRLSESDTVIEDSEPQKNLMVKNSDVIRIPIYDAQISCGFGFQNYDHIEEAEVIEFTKGQLMTLGVPKNLSKLILAKASGDSMKPKINDGEWLFIDTSETDFESILNGKVYAFNINGEMICKRIFKEDIDTLIFRSDNSDKATYPDKVVSRKSFANSSFFGRVHLSINSV